MSMLLPISMAAMAAPPMMKVSMGAALMMGAMLPPAMMKPPNTQTNKTTRPIALIIDFLHSS